MYMVTVCDSRSGPPRIALVPELNRRGSVKSWSPPMVEMMTAKTIVGLSSGTVIDQNCLDRLAPSIEADSYRSRGMACMAARKISAL